MVSQTQHSAGFVLHNRSYTDSKVLVSVFTSSMGRFTGVYRLSKRRNNLTPFCQYEFDLQGAGELKTLKTAEATSAVYLSGGRSLYCGIYLNELVTRALPEHQPFTQLYLAYIETIEKLAVANENRLQEVLLRRFEFKLLEELGLGLSFNRSADGAFIDSNAGARYEFIPTVGFSTINAPGTNHHNVFSGQELSSIYSGEWDSLSLKAAKKISRIALAQLLGEKPIKARELFT